MNALALVIGNANYTAEKDRLNNAVNDAEDISEKLLNLGFIVKPVLNCNLETFEREVRSFGEDLKQYDVGLFYFSGHGLQIDGKNYLTSVDSSFVDDVSAKHTSYPLDQVIDYMQRANPIVKVLVLDACRDNPLPSQYRGLNNQGLAPIHAPKGTIIAFSTSPGERALDYGAGRNSIYTGAVLNHIDDTNIPIEDFFKRVRTSVYTLSNGKQTSWEHTSLIGDFYFNSGQLIHSANLPYKFECVADENFVVGDSAIDIVIGKLRSHNFYDQKHALELLLQLSANEIDDSSQFLLGRNILQSAIGGEFAANSIIKRLDTWLKKYSSGESNHVLNGILFEIYFNSKGLFRQRDFKNQLIEEIFKLQRMEAYKSSFDFIVKQLEPFSEFIYYFPKPSAVALPIEVKFDKMEVDYFGTPRTVYQLISVKHQEIELFKSNSRDLTNIYDYESFIGALSKELCVPRNMLRLSSNFSEEVIGNIEMPWTLILSRKNNK